MSWRRSGVKNGEPWRVVPALDVLLTQIEADRPGGDHPADGTISSPAHDAASPNSDHREDEEGWVRAADIGETEPGYADQLCEALRLSRDPRLLYVIHDERMFSSYPAHGIAPYSWRPYTGANPHGTHGHISIVTDPELESDTREWQIGDSDMADSPADGMSAAEVNTAKAWERAFTAAGVAKISTTEALMVKLIRIALSYPPDPAELPSSGSGDTVRGTFVGKVEP